MQASRCRRSRTGSSATMLRANCAMERDGARRYLLLRPDALMAMFRLLQPDTRALRRAGTGSAPARLGQRARLPGAQGRRRRNAADDHRAHFAAAWLGHLALRSGRWSAAPRSAQQPVRARLRPFGAACLPCREGYAARLGGPMAGPPGAEQRTAVLGAAPRGP